MNKEVSGYNPKSESTRTIEIFRKGTNEGETGISSEAKEIKEEINHKDKGIAWISLGILIGIIFFLLISLWMFIPTPFDGLEDEVVPSSLSIYTPSFFGIVVTTIFIFIIVTTIFIISVTSNNRG